MVHLVNIVNVIAVLQDPETAFLRYAQDALDSAAACPCWWKQAPSFSELGAWGGEKLMCFGKHQNKFGVFTPFEIELNFYVPSGNVKIAIENGWFIVDFPIKMVIFHSYVKLPEVQVSALCNDKSMLCN